MFFHCVLRFLELFSVKLLFLSVKCSLISLLLEFPLVTPYEKVNLLYMVYHCAESLIGRLFGLGSLISEILNFRLYLGLIQIYQCIYFLNDFDL